MTDKEQEIPVKVVDRRWWARGDDGEAPATGSSKPTYVEELERQLAEKDRIAQEYIAKYRQAASEFEESRLRLRREISKDIERGRRGSSRTCSTSSTTSIARSSRPARRLAGGPVAGGRAGATASFFEARRARRQTDRDGRRRLRSRRARSGHHGAGHLGGSGRPRRGVVRHGYTIGDDVLRPASVAVAKA